MLARRIDANTIPTPILLIKQIMRTQIAHAFTHRFFTFNTNHNLAERAIRPFTVGRKNWLFANTPKGADASAILYSIVTTAKANGSNVYEYST